MSIEDKLRQTMKGATQEEPLPRDVWEGFQHRARRNRQVRLGSAGIALAVIVALAAVSIPRLTGDRREDRVTVTPPEWTTLTNDVFGYTIRHPQEWKEISSEDGFLVRVAPPGAAPAGDGYFEIVFLYQRRAEDFSGANTLNGIRYVVRNGDGSSGNIEYVFDWGNTSVLSATLQGQTETEITRYREVAEQIIFTLKSCNCQTPVADWQTRSNDLLGYDIAYPKDWKYGMFEAVDEFEPEDLPGLPRGEPTFAVEIQLRQDRFPAGNEICSTTPSPTAECTAITTDPVYFEGRRFGRFDESRGTERAVLYLVEWNDGLTLEVRAMGSTQALWDAHNETGDEVIRTIRAR